jgi:hypothetical protein
VAEEDDFSAGVETSCLLFLFFLLEFTLGVVLDDEDEEDDEAATASANSDRNRGVQLNCGIYIVVFLDFPV